MMLMTSQLILTHKFNILKQTYKVHRMIVVSLATTFVVRVSVSFYY